MTSTLGVVTALARVPGVITCTHDFRHGWAVAGATYTDGVRGSYDRIGLAAAFLAWAAPGVAVAVGEFHDAPTGPATLVWWGAYLAFAVVMVLDDYAGLTGWRQGLLVLLQVAFAVIVVVTSAVQGLAAVLLVLSAIALALWLPAVRATAGVVVQTLLCVILLLVLRDADPETLTVTFLSFLGFQMFAVLMIASVRAADRAREETARANVELQLAQARLLEASRAQERLRISRDLHDTVGHQLTALALNLEVAARQAEGPVAERVGLCRTMAGDLLRDVRAVVGQLRDDPADDSSAPVAPTVGSRPEATAPDQVDGGRARLLAMAKAVPRPTVHLEIDPHLRLTDDARGTAVLRCVQETITNAARHSGAENLWVSVEELDGSVTVTARDDGVGRAEVIPGNGLRGMAERFDVLGGAVAWFSGPQGGFTLQASLPVAR